MTKNVARFLQTLQFSLISFQQCLSFFRASVRTLIFYFLIIFWPVASWSSSDAKIKVAILDSVIDVYNPELAPFLNLENLASTSLSTLSHQRETPLLDLHRQYHQEVLNKQMRGDRSKIFKTKDETHGTFVARVLLHNLPPERVELIPIPVILPPPGLTKLALNLGLFLLTPQDKLERGIDKLLNQEAIALTKLFRSQNIRLVNMSIGPSHHPWISRFSKLKLFANKRAELFHRLAAMNPDVLFVMAAGNETSNLESDDQIPYFDSDLPNVLAVGATEKWHADCLAQYSNYSNSRVHLLAEGCSLLDIRWEGTSFATPLIGNHLLVQMLEENQKISASELKKNVLKYSVLRDAALNKYSTEGQVFPSFTLDKSKADIFVLRNNALLNEDLGTNKIETVDSLEEKIQIILDLDIQQRQDLISFLRSGAGAKIVRISSRDFQQTNLSRGVIINEGRITALDYASLPLKKVLMTILKSCETLLANQTSNAN